MAARERRVGEERPEVLVQGRHALHVERSPHETNEVNTRRDREAARNARTAR
jgi:hypothetical protein